MKISSQITFIGVIFVLFGAMGIMSYGTGIFIPEQDFSVLAFNGGGVLKNGLFILAGIFLFKKKPFSLNLIYLTLVLSFLHGLIPMFLIKPPVIFLFIGPLIDLALLIWVLRIRKYYFKTEEELSVLQAERGKRRLSPRQLKALTAAGLACMLVPLSIMVAWFYASSQGSTQPESVEIFHSYFPTFLQGRYASSYLSIPFCLVAIVLGGISLRLKEKFWQVINIFVLVLSSLLLLMNLFSMM